MVGEIFEEPWNNFTDDVIATVRVDGTVGYNYAAQSLLIQVQSGSGYAYATNRGLGNEGLVFQGSQPYEGYFYALVSGPTGSSATLRVQLRDFTSTTVLASSDFTVYTSSNWQRFDYNMTPTAGTTCEGIAPGSDPSIDCGTNFPTFAHICVRCGGEFAIGVVGSAGMTVHVGYVLLQPGAWGRFGNLPVLQSAVDTLQAMGINTIRQGGTVAQTLAWKQWRGPAEQRQSVGWKWGASLVSGWGPFEFIDMCNTMGIEPVITLRMEQNASDWADLVEYAFGSNSTLWGAQRFADGHPQPYDIRVFELGNEEVGDGAGSHAITMRSMLAVVRALSAVQSQLGGAGGGDGGAARGGRPAAAVFPVHVPYQHGPECGRCGKGAGSRSACRQHPARHPRGRRRRCRGSNHRFPGTSKLPPGRHQLRDQCRSPHDAARADGGVGPQRLVQHRAAGPAAPLCAHGILLQ